MKENSFLIDSYESLLVSFGYDVNIYSFWMNCGEVYTNGS